LGIRETLNENRSVTVGAAVGLTLLAVLWIAWYSTNAFIIAPPSDTHTMPLRKLFVRFQNLLNHR
jgi:hypothetical protein